jgi:hypothetical protein
MERVEPNEVVYTLNILNLEGTHVTDAGLMHLAALRNLQGILLGGTQVTEAGVEKLQRALPKCTIHR